MSTLWNEAEIQRHITDSIPESLNLDYKAAGALAKSNEKRAEVTKDVSAMANSDGGILIYGISEDKTVTPPVPSQITPVDAGSFSREWLEQVINTIRPRLDGVIIHPVQLSCAPNHFAYVVEIPRSTTAHQAQDKKYYKRFNFESTAMEDYEIRDVMGRLQYPRIEVKFEIEKYRHLIYKGNPLDFRNQATEVRTSFRLKIWAHNTGLIFAQYVNANIEIPEKLLFERRDTDGNLYRKRSLVDRDGITFYRRSEDNTVQDNVPVSEHVYRPGPVRYVPILPSRSQKWEDVSLNTLFETIDYSELFIYWETFADNAPKVARKISVQDIPFVDNTAREPE